MIIKKLLLFLFLFLSLFNNLFGQDKIIATGDTWLYYDESSPLLNTWYKNNNISNDWKKGISPLGYGDSIIATKISYGKVKKQKDITKYFRKVFFINDPYQHLIYKLDFQRDDGIIIYLNGREVARNNMPNGLITNTTKAIDLIFSTETEKIFHSVLLSPDDFVQGENTFSISVHQAKETSSDCLFNLKLTASDDPKEIPLLLKEQTIKFLNLDLKLSELNHIQELENKNLQLDFLTQSKNSIKLSLIITGILFSVSLLLLFILWKNFITKQQSLIITNKELEEKLINKDREMMNVSLRSLSSNQLLKELKKGLESSIKRTADKKELIGKIKRFIVNINYNLNFEEDWESLKKYFNAVYTGYVDRLLKLHPTLTDVEVRHCIFMKLHMQTKEIASVLNIDPRSVQASRYRIKKKMNLNENTDLRAYILKL